MRILAVTDLHGVVTVTEKLRDVVRRDKPEVMIFAGDVTHFSTSDVYRRLVCSFKDVVTPIIHVPGNCDPAEVEGWEENGVIPLHARGKSINGIDFLGLGGSNLTPFGTPFEIDESRIRELLTSTLQSFVRNTDNPLILVSHPSPFGTKTDVIPRRPYHVGSVSVRKFTEDAKPTLVICGHIHEGRGLDRIGETIIVNPGPAREGCYALIDIKVQPEIRFERV